MPQEPSFNYHVGLDDWYLKEPVWHVCCLFSRYLQSAVWADKSVRMVRYLFLDVADVKCKLDAARRSHNSKGRHRQLAQGDRVYHHHAVHKQGLVSSRGRAIVIGQDEGVAIVKHGGGINKLPNICARPEREVVEVEKESEPPARPPEICGGHIRLGGDPVDAQLLGDAFVDDACTKLFANPVEMGPYVNGLCCTYSFS